MKKIKIITSLFLMFTLATVSFAGGPHHGPSHGHHNPPPHHHGGHHGHYYSSHSNAAYAFFGLTALTAIAIAASNSAKKNKPKEVVVVEKQYTPAQDLTLSQLQQESMQRLFDTNRERLNMLRVEKNAKAVALEQERAKAVPNQATINSLENDISNLSMEIYKTEQNTNAELQRILTPQQYEAMKNSQL
jgi:Spy/CpxP family protein refolding chaperone